MFDRYEIEFSLMRKIERCCKISGFFGVLFAGLFFALTFTCFYIAIWGGNTLKAVVWSGIVLGVLFLCCTLFVVLQYCFENKLVRIRAESREAKEHEE